MNHRIFERILHSRLRPRVCLPERQCVSSPHLPLLYKGTSVDLGVRSLSCIIERLGSPEKQSYVRLSHNQRGRPLRWTIVRFDSCLPKYDLDRIDFRCRNPCFFTHSSLHRKEYPKKLHLLTSVQTRLPAEFKHITKRRKRN